MTWTTVQQEVRRMRFEELYERRQRRELSMAEAAEMLGVTERTFAAGAVAMRPRGRQGYRISEWAGCRPEPYR
jgi:hypothetical protein